MIDLSVSDLYLADARYLPLLERMRDLIAADLPLEYWDSTAVGAKETHNSWGLCSSDPIAYPDREDHLWPEEVARHAPRYREKNQTCPFDRGQDGSSGCFFRCSFFHPQGPVPDQSQALRMYESRIDEIKEPS